MNRRFRLVPTAILCCLVGHDISLFAQTTAFTYQGRLSEGGDPAGGSYDLRCALFNAGTGGAQTGPVLTNSATAVSNGLFTLTLDFGSGIFNGTSYWLELAVRTNGGGSFTTLSPRQPLAPAPYSIYAANAGKAASAATLSGAVPAAGLSGSYTEAISLSNASNQLSGTFSGSGSGLTNIQWLEVTVGQSNAMFGPFTTGTTSSGLQEALDYIPKNPATNGTPRGARIILGPGSYSFSQLVLTNRFLTSVYLQGAGEIATALHCTGTRDGVITTGNTGQTEGGRLHLYVHDVACIMDNNTTNAFWNLREYAVVNFQNCYFSYNGYITNSQWGISTGSGIPNPVNYPLSVYGVWVHDSDENNTWFNKCHFNGLAVGIRASCAHFFVEDCEFIQNGNYNGGATNAWPKTSGMATGAAILMDGMSYEAYLIRCDFVGNRVQFALLNSIAGQYYVSGNYLEAGGYSLNDDTGGLLQCTDFQDLPTVRKISSSDYTSLAGSLSVYSTYSGYLPGSFDVGSGPLWVLFANGTSQLQMMNDSSFRFAGNVVLAPGASFKGNGSNLTNLNAATLTGTLRPGNLPGVTTNVSIPGVTLYITNGLIMRVSTP